MMLDGKIENGSGNLAALMRMYIFSYGKIKTNY